MRRWRNREWLHHVGHSRPYFKAELCSTCIITWNPIAPCMYFLNNVTDIYTKYSLNNYTEKAFRLLRDFETLERPSLMEK